MNKALLVLVVISTVMLQLAGAASAAPITINDGYVGETPSNTSYPGLEVGFCWTVTSTNDVVEGGGRSPVAPVPEPATLVLLGFGLIGIAGLGRRMRSKTETQTLD